MKIHIRHPEEHQYMKDLAYIAAERDFIELQELAEEFYRERKPAKIEVIYEDKLIEENDRIEIDTCLF